ncbi:hypothetical protein JLT2_69 [Paraglaciecola Antarctic JLT virus 2]|nr:hypothetical protein JLT2_69 [Paraglaciecola Antarctic JLT virus 2]
MNEYNCSCHIDGQSYSMQTVKCISTFNAMQQLKEHVKIKGGNFNLVDGLSLDLVEV